MYSAARRRAAKTVFYLGEKEHTILLVEAQMLSLAKGWALEEKDGLQENLFAQSALIHQSWRRFGDDAEAEVVAAKRERHTATIGHAQFIRRIAP